MTDPNMPSLTTLKCSAYSKDGTAMSTTTAQTRTTHPAINDPIRVVMIDDDPSEHVLMQAAAREASVDSEFTFFEDGADALLHLLGKPAEELPHLIVLDLRMPGLDGHSTLDELQADPELWQVPVVVFTSSPRVADLETSITRGAVSYVVKPSDFDTMVRHVSDFFDLARQGVKARLVSESESGRGERRETVEQIGVLVEDYLLQLQLEALAQRDANDT